MPKKSTFGPFPIFKKHKKKFKKKLENFGEENYILFLQNKFV